MSISNGHDHISEKEIDAALKLLCDPYRFGRALRGVNPMSVTLQEPLDEPEQRAIVIDDKNCWHFCALIEPRTGT